MIFLKFLWEFIKIGALTYGGGLAMIPILRDVSIAHLWLTDAQFTDLIAISQSTPGPIAINMATYIGYREFSLSGAIWASLSIVLPSFLLAILLGKILVKYSHEKGVKAAFVGLKAAVIGLIATSIVQVSLVSLYENGKGTLFRFWEYLDFKALIMVIVGYYIIRKTQKHPIVYIAISGFIGVLIWG